MVVRWLIDDGVETEVGAKERFGSGFDAVVFDQRENGGKFVFAGLGRGLEERQSWREVVRVLPPLLHVSSRMGGHLLNRAVLPTDHQDEIRGKGLDLLRHTTRDLLSARLAPQRGGRGRGDGLLHDCSEGLL